MDRRCAVEGLRPREAAEGLTRKHPQTKRLLAYCNFCKGGSQLQFCMAVVDLGGLSALAAPPRKCVREKPGNYMYLILYHKFMWIHTYSICGGGGVSHSAVDAVDAVGSPV